MRKSPEQTIPNKSVLQLLFHSQTKILYILQQRFSKQYDQKDFLILVNVCNMTLINILLICKLMTGHLIIAII